MSDDNNDKNTKDQGEGFRLGDLRELISQEIKKFASSVNNVTDTDTKAHDQAQALTEKKLDSKSTIADEVQRAIADIKQKEAATQRESDIDNKLGELFKRTEEQPPVERRRVHKIMGWGE